MNVTLISFLINKRWHGDHSALRHVPALNNKLNYCIHVQVYLFVLSPHARFHWFNHYAYLKLGVSASYVACNVLL